jgi:hypothetical protein
MSTTVSGPKAPKDLGFFRRKLNSLNSGLVGSTCRKCCSFVGASARPELLDCVERLHHCVSRGTKASFPGVAPA